MKKTAQKEPVYIGVSTDINPHPLLFNLKQIGSYSIREKKSYFNNTEYQLFILENKNNLHFSYIFQISYTLRKTLKIPLGIDYIIYPESTNEVNKITACLDDIENIKGIFILNNPEIKKYLPHIQKLSTLKVKKIPVN